MRFVTQGSAPAASNPGLEADAALGHSFVPQPGKEKFALVLWFAGER